MVTYPGPLFHNPQGLPPPPVDREAPDPRHPCMGGCPHGHSCQSENMHAHKPTIQPPLQLTTTKTGLFCTITQKAIVLSNWTFIKNDWKDKQATHLLGRCLQQ